MAEHPIWLNRDVPLYVVVVERPNKSRESFLVLTAKGPVTAKDIGEHAAQGRGRAIKSQQIPTPLIVGDIREVEHVLNPDKVSVVATPSQLRVIRVEMAHPDGLDKTLLVWTARGVAYAEDLAVRSIPGAEHRRTMIVTNPVIIADNLEKIAEPA